MNPSTQLTFADITQSIDDWALDYGVLPEVIIARLERGWSIERAITEPMVVAPGQKLPESFPFLTRRRASKRAPARRETWGKRYEHAGKNLTLTEWSELTGVKRAMIEYRLQKGLSIEEAIEEASSVQFGPKRASNYDLGAHQFANARRYKHAGKNLTLREWSELTGINMSTLTNRLRRGLSFEQAITIKTMPLGPNSRQRLRARQSFDRFVKRLRASNKRLAA